MVGIKLTAGILFSIENIASIKGGFMRNTVAKKLRQQAENKADYKRLKKEYKEDKRRK